MIIEILVTGHELLEGTIQDHHCQYVARYCTGIGVQISRFNTIRDSLKDLTQTLSEITHRADVCLITGGLGPTSDDLTLDALAQVAGVQLNLSDSLWQTIQKRYPKHRPLPPSNQRQARIPEGGTPLDNPYGTAPGMKLKIGKCLIFAFPGVPTEFQKLSELHFFPWLREQQGIADDLCKTNRLCMLRESEIDYALSQLQWPEGIRLGYQALGTEHRVKVYGKDPLILQQACQMIQTQFPQNYLNDQDKSLVEEVVDALKQKKWTLGCAESCTGGGVGAQITRLAGVSSVFMGGIISYSNEVKMHQLGVHSDTLVHHGAVSEKCAGEMALGVQNALKVDWGISVTGIAGPGGATPTKPVGTVCFGWAGPQGVETLKMHFDGSRNRVQKQAIGFVLHQLLLRLKQN